jgi:putative hydrolase of HD superfamily
MVNEFGPFLDAAIGLKYIARAGWSAKASIQNPESVADHSFAMCAIGMALSDIMGLDTKKVLKMIILHDLAESIVGDYMPGEISEPQKHMQEHDALKGILECLPASVRSEYGRIWHEYVQSKTHEARFVHRIDKLEMALQASRYARDGHSKDLLREFLESAHKVVDIDSDILTEILKSLNLAATRREE